MSRPLRLALRRTLHTTSASCARIQHPGELPSWGPTPPVNPLLTTPPKPVPSYRSPSSSQLLTPKPPAPTPTSGARLAEGEAAPVELGEDDPYANFVAPQLTPRKDLWEEVQRQRREREAKQRHGNVYKELLPGMVIPLAIAFATYAALRAFRTDLATERETAELSAQVYDKQAQLEAALARPALAPAPAAVLVGSNDTPVAAAPGEGGSGTSWWKVW